MPIEKINTQLAGLPPTWMSRVQKGSASANATELRKVLGEPLPQVLDVKTLPPNIAAYFAPNGVLERIRKKLATISRKKGGKILPAKNTIASVDDDENIYVGVDFLEQYGEDDALLAGILAHEWGHMLSDLPKNVNWSKLSWDDLHAIRRDEEGDADGFAGRAMFLLGYSPDSMIEFLRQNDRKRKEKKLPCHKYHNFATREAILRESFEAERRAVEMAKRLFIKNKQSTGPKFGRLIGSG